MNLALSYPLLGPVGEPLIQPTCVSVSPTGRYAITDSKSCMVVVYTKMGVYSHHFSTLPKRLLYLYWNITEHEPHSVAWLADERLVYSQPSGGAVVICHGNGQRCGVISGRPLYEPYGLAVNSVDQIFVVDRKKGRVLCYDCSGKLLRTLGGFGAVEGELTLPHYVVIGPGDTIYVNNVPPGQTQNLVMIHKYSNRGAVIDSCVTSVTAEPAIGSLAVDDTGAIYQLDLKSQQIIQVREAETTSENESESSNTTCTYQEEVVMLQGLKQLVYAAIGRTSEVVCLDIGDMTVKIYTQPSLALENGDTRRYMRDSREILNDFDSPPMSPTETHF